VLYGSEPSHVGRHGFAKTALRQLYRALPKATRRPLCNIVYCSQEIMLLAIHFDAEFIEIVRINIAVVLSFQSAATNGNVLDAPETNSFS
jgi:hypothetical protein|tara:strand:- start:1548 stop:1817 length:270 start_codon:yes stop_codon:yes gene_type:complete